MRHRATLPPLPAKPASLTEQEMHNWRTRLEKYVGFVNQVVDNTVPGYASSEGWGYLADAYVSDFLNRWNESENDPTNGKRLLGWATTALTYAGGSSTQSVMARYAQGLLYRVENDYRALAQFQNLIADGLGFPRCYAQYANELINQATLNDPSLADAVKAANAAISAALATIKAGGMELSLGTFYWILGRAYFFNTQYEKAIPNFLLSISGDSTPPPYWARSNVWYNQLYLVSAYTHNNDRRNADLTFGNFQGNFPKFNKNILDSYEKDLPNSKLLTFRDGLRNYYN